MRWEREKEVVDRAIMPRLDLERHHQWGGSRASGVASQVIVEGSGGSLSWPMGALPDCSGITLDRRSGGSFLKPKPACHDHRIMFDASSLSTTSDHGPHNIDDSQMNIGLEQCLR